MAGWLAPPEIGDLLDAVLAVELAGVYKLHPEVYQLAVDRLAVPAEATRFSLRMPGTLTPPRPSACASCGATATANRRSACRESPIARSPSWRNCRRWLVLSPDESTCPALPLYPFTRTLEGLCDEPRTTPAKSQTLSITSWAEGILKPTSDAAHQFAAASCAKAR